MLHQVIQNHMETNIKTEKHSKEIETTKKNQMKILETTDTMMK